MVLVLRSAVVVRSEAGAQRRRLPRKANTSSPRFCRFQGSCAAGCKRCARVGGVIVRAADGEADTAAVKEPEAPPAPAPTPAPAAPAAFTPAAASSSSGKYPEWGSTWYDDPAYENSLWKGWATNKSADQIAATCESELLHGRWAMLGVTGAYCAEKGTGIPWFKAGTVCTPDDCTSVNTIFPGQVFALVPTGGSSAFETTLPNFGAVAILTVVMMGTAEGYRAGLITPIPFAKGEYTVGDPYPGGRFDPFGFSKGSNPAFLSDLKVAELKHSRLAMLSWLAYMVQAFVGAGTFNGPNQLPSYIEGAPGPYAQWIDFLANNNLSASGLIVR